MILFIYSELNYLIPEVYNNFSVCVLYFKFLERDRNRGPWPASVILIGLDWIEVSRALKYSGRHYHLSAALSLPCIINLHVVLHCIALAHAAFVVNFLDASVLFPLRKIVTC